MIGTYLIAAVGYGLAAVFAYEFTAHGLRSILVDGLEPGRHGRLALAAAVLSVIAAAATRWLTGGAL